MEENSMNQPSQQQTDYLSQDEALQLNISPTGTHEKNHVSDGDEVLHQKFKHLEQDWNYFKQSNPKPRRRRNRRKWFSETKPKTISDYKSSPTDLVTRSLQAHQTTTLEGEWKVWTNDLAVLEEFHKETKPVMRMPGRGSRLKGRRLFQSSDNLSGNEEWWHGTLEKESEHPDSGLESEPDFESGTCSTSSVSAEKGVAVAVEEVKEDRHAIAAPDGTSGGRSWTGLMGLFVVVVLVYALCIISYCCLQDFTDEEYYYDMNTMTPT